MIQAFQKNITDILTKETRNENYRETNDDNRLKRLTKKEKEEKIGIELAIDRSQ